MIMRLSLCLCMVLYSIIAIAQVDYTKDYYPNIYAAENKILVGNYKDAIMHYNSAFSKVPKSFARDYLNAAVVAAKLGKKKLALRYCDSLIAKGVKADFFIGHVPLQLL